MALTIVVRSSDSGERPSLTLDAPRVVIGRGEGCEVRLPDPSVSHRHASIRQRGADYILLDEGSTNGTYVGGVRLSPQAPRILKSGELIRVGRVWLEARIEQAPATQEVQLATKQIALRLVEDALSAQGESLQLRVTVCEGPDQGSELVLNDFDKPYVVGRGSGTDLKVSDEDASRRHVELRRRGDGVWVKDLGSKNGTLIDDEPLPADARREWKAGSTLKVGTNTFRYDEPLAEALNELEQASDEPVSDGDVELEPGSEGDAAAPPVATAPDENAPVGASPAEAAARRAPRRLFSTDVLVALLAVCVLGLSALGLLWLFGAP